MRLGAYKKQIFLGLAMFLVGFSSAAAVGRHRLKQKPSAPVKSEVLGETATPQFSAEGQSMQAASDKPQGSNPAPASTPPAPQPVPLPQAAAPAVKPKPKIDYCKQYKEELAKTQDSVELKFQSDGAAAKNQYDTEQAALAAQFSDLAKLRNQAINDYLTAIALATSKYNNSAKAPADYQLYEQEQSAALAIHNQAIKDITAKEASVTQTKTESQNRYDQSLKIFLDQKNQNLSDAQIKYQAQAAGLVCKPQL